MTPGHYSHHAVPSSYEWLARVKATSHGDTHRYGTHNKLCVLMVSAIEHTATIMACDLVVWWHYV
jgi:hypothetical protein